MCQQSPLGVPMSDAEEQVNKKPSPARPGATADLPGPRLEAGARIGHFRIEPRADQNADGSPDEEVFRNIAIQRLYSVPFMA
jgi:hypothetical protein